MALRRLFSHDFQEAAGERAEDATLAPGPAAEPTRLRTIERILQGDTTVLNQLVADLEGDEATAAAPWRPQLELFFETILEAALEAGIVDVPSDHPFWDNFTPAQRRDLLRVLGGLGYAYDGLGGWIDDRVPAKRDLSVAVGYLGLDPVRIRSWPTPPETQTLLARALIAGNDYLAEFAPGLTRAELEPVLEAHLAELAPLLDAWDQVRPRLETMA